MTEEEKIIPEKTDKEISTEHDKFFKEKCKISEGKTFAILVPIKGEENSYLSDIGLVTKVIDKNTAEVSVEGKEGIFKIKRKELDVFEYLD